MVSSAHANGAVAAFVVATAPGDDPAPRDLLWRPVLGRPLVAWPLGALARLNTIASCALAVPPARRADGVKLTSAQPPSPECHVIAVEDGPWFDTLEALVHSSPLREEWIILLDATLPLVTTKSLRAGLQAATRTGVAIAAEPVKETLKRVEGQVVAETLPRESLRRLLPPIIFQREALQHALDNCNPHRTDAHDLVALTQLAGVPLTTFDVDYPCVRVTSEHDLAIVESLLRQRESESSAT